MTRGAYTAHLFASLAVLSGGIWLSTGTLAPYAATLDAPMILERCDYLANIDHWTFKAPYLMLAGFPRGAWEWSVVLRRILYPLAAYPFMRQLGFETGGVVFNLLLNLTSFVVFVRWLAAREGNRPAVVAMWLLATYPGITYWTGLPYSYAAIVPASLLSMMALTHLTEPASTPRIALLTGAIGVLSLAYDLLPFFGLAAILVLLHRRQFFDAALSLPCLAAPTIAAATILQRVYGVPVINSNTATYENILTAYLHPKQLQAWWHFLARFPEVLLKTYLFGHFLFLPLFFIGIVALEFRAGHKGSLRLEESALLVAGAAVFTFNNAAPPYSGWQLRGEWISRLYQPVFVALVLYSARNAATSLSLGLAGLVATANAAVIAAPAIGLEAPLDLYQRFYQHGTPKAFVHNLEVFGRRPMGFCRGPIDEGSTNPDIFIAASSFSRGNGIVDRGTSPSQQAVVAGASSPTLDLEYDVHIPRPGRYRLDLRCATADFRPFHVFIAGEAVGDGPRATTGGFGITDQRWQVIGARALPRGRVTVRLERNGPICLLQALRLRLLESAVGPSR